MHFAEPIKEVSKVLMGWDDRHVYGTLKETIDPKWGISPRKFLQVFGTDMMQKVLSKVTGYKWGRGHWVKLLLAKAEKSPADIILVPDVRFNTEAEAILNEGGINIEVFQPVEQSVKGFFRKLLNKLFPKGIYKHSSEKGIKSKFINYRIPNEKIGLEWLIEDVYAFCKDNLLPFVINK